MGPDLRSERSQTRGALGEKLDGLDQCVNGSDQFRREFICIRKDHPLFVNP